MADLERLGGVADRVLAAHRAGITRVILPSRNARDIDDVPETVRAQMEFILAEDMSEVLAHALEARGAEVLDVPLASPPAGGGTPLHVRG